MIGSIRALTRTRHLPSTSQKHYCLNQLALSADAISHHYILCLSLPLHNLLIVTNVKQYFNSICLCEFGTWAGRYMGIVWCLVVPLYSSCSSCPHVGCLILITSDVPTCNCMVERSQESISIPCSSETVYLWSGPLLPVQPLIAPSSPPFFFGRGCCFCLCYLLFS